MSVVARYFRQHRWQRRAVTASLAAICGVLAAWVALPMVRDRQLAKMLGSPEPGARQRGIAWGRQVAPRRPQLVALLERQLDAADDLKFAAIAEVLTRVGRFNARWRTGEQLDRYDAVDMSFAAGARSAGRRLARLHALILGGRDNRHVRRALEMARKDEAPPVRAAAAVLAGRLGDDAALAALLKDADPSVRAAAAMDAALAGRRACLPAVAELLKRAGTDDEIAAAAYGLVRLLPKDHAAAIVEAIDKAWADGKTELLDKLLYSAGHLAPAAAGAAVRKILDESRRRKRVPPAGALIAAGRLGLAEARPAIEAVVDDFISRREELTVGEAVVLAAAVHAARRLKMPPALFVRAIEKLWHPGTATAMLLSAEALGELAAGDERAVALLRSGAEDARSPLPAAAAAVALFRLAPDEALEPLRAVCASEVYLAGDYVAWHVGRSGQPQAAAVAAVFFGPNVYDQAVRSVGALLTAMLYRGTGDAGRARAAIEARLRGGPLGGERDPFVAGSYWAALTILGDGRFAEDLLILAGADNFPKRRALTALLLGGHPGGLDRVLAARQFDPAEADSYLTGRLMARVCAAVAPDLPPFDIDAQAWSRLWQCRILRDHYLIHRRAVPDRMRP